MTYIIRAAGPGPAQVTIRRVGDSMSDPRDRRNHMLLSNEQEAVYQQAVKHVKNGNKEAALQVLRDTFEQAWIEQ